MVGILAFGFLVGMGHALEADHLAAVAALSANRQSRRGLVFMGAAWGIGHTITLFAVCSAVILFGYVLTARMTATIEFAVGVMLIVLGLNVFRKLRRAKIHFHVHDHADSRPHIHAHSHATARLPHDEDPHCHPHPRGFPVRALLVGLVHGAAGSAALLALALASAHHPRTAILYVLLFGVGSLLGMTVLSFVASWPLGLAERAANWLHRGITIAIAGGATALGVYAMVVQWPAIWMA